MLFTSNCVNQVSLMKYYKKSVIQGILHLVMGWTCFGSRVFSSSTSPFLTKNCPYTSSKSSSNLDIELRTSRTLLPSPKAELYELKHLKRSFEFKLKFVPPLGYMRPILAPKQMKLQLTFNYNYKMTEL